ncbi:carotenoid phi-ring synthase-like isoform X3 [Amphiura filiformis]|uniref:carotenoid phi-ring synthase-like isoform X3 n=1 Tax=Amphiura filiformis TaxID=82378 RepID=UPI003B21B547
MGLKRTAVSIVLAGIFIVYMFGYPKSARIIPPANPDDPPRLPEGQQRNVLIIGGGLAGMSAALELAERGYQVTIREADSVLGGRLHTRPVERLGQTFQVEHGFHAWFHNYHQFKDIRERLDIDKNFQTWGSNFFRWRKYLPEEISSWGPYPINMLGIVLKSQNLGIVSAMKNQGPLADLMNFDMDVVYDKYDQYTFDEWAKLRNLDTTFYDVMLRPALSVTLNEENTLSAAEMLMYSHFYFLSDAEADKREITRMDYGSAVINPWAKRLQELGARIELNAKVERLLVDDKTGKIIGESSHPEEKYDHVILAPNLQGVEEILTAPLKVDSPAKQPIQKILKDVSQLEIAPPYKVLRAWFDKELENSGSAIFLQVPDFDPVSAIGQYHWHEKESEEWANKTGGSIMEFHLYDWKFGNVRDEDIWGLIAPTVKEIYPEMFERDFKMLAYHVNSYENFPSFKKGLQQYRPNATYPSQCGIPNLSFAGDWLRTSYPSALMERAVSTGREAANHVLLSDHIRQAPFKVCPSRGPGFGSM